MRFKFFNLVAALSLNVRPSSAADRPLACADRLFQSSNLISYCDAIVFALRSGKLREMLYSVILEAWFWWCYLFRINSRLIEFNSTPFWRCRSEYPFDFVDLAATLRLCNFSVVESATRWSVITENADGKVFGATHDRPQVLQTGDNLWSTATELFEFNKPIFAVFISGMNHLFVVTKGWVYRSKDGGRHFDVVLQLSHGDSTVWHNHGIDETPQGLVIGEYASIIKLGRNRDIWKSVAYLYFTEDDGESWRRIDHLAREGASKHVHLVRYSRRFARLLVTDGDKRKQSYWVGPGFEDMVGPSFKQGRFDSLALGGGHTAFTETHNATLLGTDYRVGPNSIICLRSPEYSTARMLPSPYRYSPILNMHSITSRNRSITFASLHGGLCDQWKSALIYSDDSGDSWYRLIEFDRYVDFSIVNSQQGPNCSLVAVVNNVKSGEKRTIILSGI